MNKWWKHVWTSLPWATKHKERVAEMLLTALKHDSGTAVVELLEAHFNGREGLSNLQMSWNPNEALLTKIHGYDEKTEFDTDLLSVVYQNKCVNTLQAIAQRGWLSGEEWVWYGKPNSSKEDGALFAAPLKHAVFAVVNGHLFWIQQEDELRGVWGPEEGQSKADWIVDQILFSTKAWEKRPGFDAFLEKPNWCPPPTEFTLAAWLAKGWVEGKDLIDAQESLLENHATMRTKKGPLVTEIIPKSLLAKEEASLLRKKAESSGVGKRDVAFLQGAL